MPTTNDDAVIILETPDIADISIFAEDPAQLDMDTIERGPAGRDATINGVNTLTLVAEQGLGYTQEGDTLTLFVDPATQEDIDEAIDQYKPLTPSQLYYAIVRGLAYNNLSFTSTERAAALDWLGVNDSTITLTQGGETKGSFTLNQDGDATIELDDGQTIQLEEMPEASEEYVGPIYQYIGIDTQNYTHGYFYECIEVSQDTYEWQQTDVQPIKSTYMTYPVSWPTNSTTKAFCDAIAIDTTAVVGKAYLGEVTFTDISSLGLGNAEVVVEIMSGTTASDKVIVLTMSSGNVSPYLWRYTYWNHGTNVSGWIGFQPKLTAGDGIELLNNTISAVGLRNKNTAAGTTNPIYDWVGTLQEYQDQYIERDHPDWICYITDDTAADTYEAYSKTQSDSRYYQKTEVNSLLEDKVNLNADNFNNNGKAFISGLGRAGDKFEVLVPVNGAQYTAPANGYFVLDGIITNAAGNRLYLLLKNEQYISNNKLGYQCFGILAGYRQYSWVPVRKGDVVSVTAESTATSPDFGLRFYYAEGEHVTPPTYTEVEYIEGTYNTQYIKAGVVPASGMKLYCKIQTTGNSSNFGWGARNITYDGAQMNISVTNQYVVVDWFGASSADRWTVNTSVTSSDIFELSIENNLAVLTKNGTNIATRTFTPSTTITRELYLTAFNNNGALGTAGTTGRLYAFKLWTPDNELLLDMVPAKDGSGVACLYNRATDTIYYNQGTGSYTAGPDVN